MDNAERKYMDIEQLKQAVNALSTHPLNEWDTMRVLELIDKQPPADVKPIKRGRWTLNKDGSGTCSECHFTQSAVWDLDNHQNFCGHCGADMR